MKSVFTYSTIIKCVLSSIHTNFYSLDILPISCMSIPYSAKYRTLYNICILPNKISMQIYTFMFIDLYCCILQIVYSFTIVLGYCQKIHNLLVFAPLKYVSKKEYLIVQFIFLLLVKEKPENHNMVQHIKPQRERVFYIQKLQLLSF